MCVCVCVCEERGFKGKILNKKYKLISLCCRLCIRIYSISLNNYLNINKLYHKPLPIHGGFDFVNFPTKIAKKRRNETIT